MTRIAATILAALIPCFLWWAGGFNFNERGYAAVMLTIVVIYCAGVTWFCPSWRKQ